MIIAENRSVKKSFYRTGSYAALRGAARVSRDEQPAPEVGRRSVLRSRGKRRRNSAIQTRCACAGVAFIKGSALKTRAVLRCRCPRCRRKQHSPHLRNMTFSPVIQTFPCGSASCRQETISNANHLSPANAKVLPREFLSPSSRLLSARQLPSSSACAATSPASPREESSLPCNRPSREHGTP